MRRWKIVPAGEIVVRSKRHCEDFICTDVNPSMAVDKAWEVGRSRHSVREFAELLLEAAGQESNAPELAGGASQE